MTLKQCTRCLQMLPQHEFYRDVSKRDGLTTQCKRCRHTYVRARREQARKSWGDPADHACVVCASPADLFFAFLPSIQTGLWGIALCERCDTLWRSGAIVVNPHRIATIALEGQTNVPRETIAP